MLCVLKGLDIAGAKSGRRQAQASADDVAKAYEALLTHGFKDTQIQQAMQVVFSYAQLTQCTFQYDTAVSIAFGLMHCA